jgi:hypothetical protein
VAIIEANIDSAYINIILKDFWNLVCTDDGFQAPDETSGHFRTFTVKLEDVPTMFDSLIVCRFPDNVRTQRIIDLASIEDIKHHQNSNNRSTISSRKKSKLPLPWQTEIMKGKTNGMYMYIYICIYIYLYFYLFIDLFICIYIYLYIYMCMHIYLYAYIYTNTYHRYSRSGESYVKNP